LGSLGFFSVARFLLGLKEGGEREREEKNLLFLSDSLRFLVVFGWLGLLFDGIACG
jgi:hypothetical protein